MHFIKASRKHKAENVIQAFLNIIDNVVMIATLGNVDAGAGYRFVLYRLRNQTK